MHAWEIKAEPWRAEYGGAKARKHYGDDDLIIVVRDENDNEVMWIGVCELLDTIGSRYALAHILDRIKQGVESKPALLAYRHMAGEIAAHGENIHDAMRRGLARIEKRKVARATKASV